MIAFSVHGYSVVLEHESCFLPIVPKGGKSFIISEGKAVLSLVNTITNENDCASFISSFAANGFFSNGKYFVLI